MYHSLSGINTTVRSVQIDERNHGDGSILIVSERMADNFVAPANGQALFGAFVEHHQLHFVQYMAIATRGDSQIVRAGFDDLFRTIGVYVAKPHQASFLFGDTPPGTIDILGVFNFVRWRPSHRDAPASARNRGAVH